MNLEKLHNLIKLVCPIHGISIGDASNKTTWIISFKDESTDEEKAAAQAVIDNADLSILDDPETVVRIDKLEFKDRLKSLGKYEAASAVLASMTDDDKENWSLAPCAASNNEDLLALLAAIGITDITRIFY